MRRTNSERTDSMRTALIAAARHLFVRKGYADTSTPDIVTMAGVTRGALYHHFEDKKALFLAVVEQEAAAVASQIETAGGPAGDPRAALIHGTRAYFDAMEAPGRTRLLLLDGPAVLGTAALRAIDGEHAEAALKRGLFNLLTATGKPVDRVGAVTDLLSAAFDRAALAIDAGGDRALYEQAVEALIDGLLLR
ncbi:TetR/AcrR family transcriptional regulator [Pararhizobium sp.]|uniref:TetR/AcrR family transcriptional regulator n=1 Tax=Pararhizobium sp. TaxID=1977563 RepID=UPI002725AE77|nr:TetR/AcrR family transcriptional regulator [Pararhizobium sp.]MDO9417882.1 TetR/AcrR family transcriptional regulator [Pararhizobium sp.]